MLFWDSSNLQVGSKRTGPCVDRIWLWKTHIVAGFHRWSRGPGSRICDVSVKALSLEVAIDSEKAYRSVKLKDAVQPKPL